jgi:hypothetical protein
MSRGSDEPTSRQLHFLRALAERTGTTFSYPRTGAEASAEIRRLKAMPSLTRDERRQEHDGGTGDWEALRPSSAVRSGEISGYGSTATWAERS